MDAVCSACCVGRSRMPGDWSGDCTWHELGRRWFPVPAGGDLGRGPMVPAVWPALPGCRGAAGRAWHHRRSRHRLPLSAAFHPGADRGCPARPARPGARWFAGETYLKAASQWTYRCQAAGQHGQVIDVLLSARRDLAAARHFFTRALRAGTIPVEVSTDRAHVYPRVPDELIPRPCTPSSNMRTTRSRQTTDG